MIEKLKEIYWNWRFCAEVRNPAGWAALWVELKFWWQDRPRRTECSSGCGIIIWKKGSDKQERYCSDGCAYYGPDGCISSPEDDEIPF